MNEDKSAVSQAQSYQEIGEFWDSQDLSAVWEQTELVEFEVDIQAQASYLPIEINLSHKLRSVATQRGVSTETLVNLWLQERVAQEAAQ